MSFQHYFKIGDYHFPPFETVNVPYFTDRSHNWYKDFNEIKRDDQDSYTALQETQPELCPHNVSRKPLLVGSISQIIKVC